MALRNHGIITQSDYVGKKLDEAKDYAKSGGFTVRIVEENGVAKMLDMSVNQNRINFRVSNGVVTDVFGG